MTGPGEAAVPISVVIPVAAGGEDPRELFAELSKELAGTGDCEFVFVVDGRENPALAAIREIKRDAGDAVTVVVFARPFGESAALMAGFQQARGSIILALLPDLQVEPSSLTNVVRPLLEEEADLVVGRRFPRRDSWFNRLQSRAFHWVVRTLTSTDFHDISCGVWAMKSTVARELRLYGDLHRFIPILAMSLGFEVREGKLSHRLRHGSVQLFTVGAYFRRLLDALTIFFLVRFTRRPLRLFGTVGLALAGVGGVLTTYLGIYRLLGLGSIGERPLLLLGVLLIVLGVQSLSIGLLGEIIIFTHARKVTGYRVAEII